MHPEFLRDGRLVEVLPNWRSRTPELSLAHLDKGQMPKARARVQGVCYSDDENAVLGSSEISDESDVADAVRRGVDVPFGSKSEVR